MEYGSRIPFYYPYGFEPFLFVEDICWLMFIVFPRAVVMAAYGIMMVALASGILYLAIRLFVWVVGKVVQHE